MGFGGLGVWGFGDWGLGSGMLGFGTVIAIRYSSTNIDPHEPDPNKPWRSPQYS